MHAPEFVDIVICLLDNRANINVVDRDGNTPLMLICKMVEDDINDFRLELVPLFLRYGAKLGIQNNEGNTILDIMYENNDLPALEVLADNIKDIVSLKVYYDRIKQLIISCKAGSSKMQLNKESSLKKLGYHTQQPADQRWTILKEKCIPALGLRKVVTHLTNMTILYRSQKDWIKYESVLKAWEYDLERIKMEYIDQKDTIIEILKMNRQIKIK